MANILNQAYDAVKGVKDDFANTNVYNSKPIGSYNFTLTVEGIYDIPLRSVKVMQKQNNFEKIREGGVNDYVHLKRMPITEPFVFQVEKYLSNSVLDPLANGAELTLPVFLKIQHGQGSERKGMEDTDAARVYMFTGCVVMGKEYGELNAEKSALATEVVTIGYKEMFIIPSLWALGGDSYGADVISDSDYTKIKNAQKTNASKQTSDADLKKAQQKLEEERKARAEANKNARKNAKYTTAEDLERAQKEAEEARKKRIEDNKKAREENEDIIKQRDAREKKPTSSDASSDTAGSATGTGTASSGNN